MNAVAMITPEPKYFANLPLAPYLMMTRWTYSKKGLGICLLDLRTMGSNVPNSDVTYSQQVNVCDKR
jgi:hypothetical protein